MQSVNRSIFTSKSLSYWKNWAR